MSWEILYKEEMDALLTEYSREKADFTFERLQEVGILNFLRHNKIQLSRIMAATLFVPGERSGKLYMVKREIESSGNIQNSDDFFNLERINEYRHTQIKRVVYD